jgi:site-specific DNA-cytosine methylase
MGTEEIVLHSIRQELHKYACQCPFEFETTFRAEQDVGKLCFLKRRFPNTSTRHFRDNNDLQHACPKDVDGQTTGRPSVDLLLCGIVCKDISQLNNKPKSEREESGTSGSSLTGLLRYVQACSFTERPQLIILECVQRLGHKRAVDPDDRTGTAYIKDELAQQGYVGEWQTVSPTMFFLPQSRPRVYGLFLKLHKHGPEGLVQRQADLSAALKLLDRLKVPGPPEALEAVLGRSRETPRLESSEGRLLRRKRDLSSSHDSACAPKHRGSVPAALGQDPDAASSSGGLKWKQQHRRWQENRGLRPMDLVGEADFKRAMGDSLLEREVDALWLRLMWLKKQSGLDWRKDLIVATVGASINFMSARRSVFPCATPGMSYVLLDHGVPQMADGITLLALQGVQRKEVCHFKLHLERGSLLKNLSGNAFTSNILAAFILAGLSARLPLAPGS